MILLGVSSVPSCSLLESNEGIQDIPPSLIRSQEIESDTFVIYPTALSNGFAQVIRRYPPVRGLRIIWLHLVVCALVRVSDDPICPLLTRKRTNIKDNNLGGAYAYQGYRAALRRRPSNGAGNREAIHTLFSQRIRAASECPILDYGSYQVHSQYASVQNPVFFMDSHRS